MRVAVIGLGDMGGRIAGRLLVLGHDVMVWNRTAERGRHLVDGGARWASTPAAAAAETSFVVTMVTDAQALLEVCSQPDGLAAGFRSGGLLVDMSTVGPGGIQAAAEVLPPGVDVVDAPVLGSLLEAERGTLTAFVGGTEPAVHRAMPILEALGTVVSVGLPGAGAASKLVANAALFGSVALVGEALALARSLGLPDDTAFDVLATTPLGHQAARRRPAVEADSFPPRFRLALAAKDARMIAAIDGASLPTIRAACGWLFDALEAGLGSADYSAFIRQILKETPGKPEA